MNICDKIYTVKTIDNKCKNEYHINKQISSGDFGTIYDACCDQNCNFVVKKIKQD